MIIPIGDHCHNAVILRDLGIRKTSYPFDWIAKSSLSKNTDILLQILNCKNDKDVETFVRDFFNLEQNSIYIDEYGTKIFQNHKYDISFPHDDINNIYEKYLRRFSRLRNDFFNSNNILILFSTRTVKDEYEKNISQLYFALSNFHKHILFFTINCFENDLIYYEHSLNITNRYLSYTYTDDEWTLAKSIYDQDIYASKLKTLFKQYINFFDQFVD